MGLNLLLYAVEIAVLGGAVVVLHGLRRRYGLAPLIAFLAAAVALLVWIVPSGAPAVANTSLSAATFVLVPVILFGITIVYVVDGTPPAWITLWCVLAVGAMVLFLDIIQGAHLAISRVASDTSLPSLRWRVRASSAVALAGAVATALIACQALENRWPRAPAALHLGPALFFGLIVHAALFQIAPILENPLARSALPATLAATGSAALLLWPLGAAHLHGAGPSAHGVRTPIDLWLGSFGRQAQALRHLEDAQRHSQETWRALVENVPAFIATVDRDGVILFSNRRDPKASANSMIGRTVFEFLQPEYHPRVNESLRRVFGAGESDQYEVRTLERHGGHWFACRVGAVRQGGEVVSATIIGTDVTERRRIEADRATLEGELRQAQKMEELGTLAGSIAHDFNNLLLGIYGFAELARQDIAEGSAARENLDRMLEAARRAARLVDQILAFSRKREPGLRVVDAVPWLHNALQLLRATLPSSVELRFEIDPAGGLIRADENQLHQVLVNLASNAAQAMQLRGGLLTITLRPRHPDAAMAARIGSLGTGEWLELTVRDTGDGMDPEVQQRIFEPFFTTKVEGQGTGLGLSVVNRIVHAHGGAIVVDSVRGEGTTFSLYFPVVAEPPPGEASAPPPRAEPEQTAASTEG